MKTYAQAEAEHLLPLREDGIGMVHAAGVSTAVIAKGTAGGPVGPQLTSGIGQKTGVAAAQPKRALLSQLPVHAVIRRKNVRHQGFGPLAEKFQDRVGARDFPAVHDHHQGLWLKAREKIGKLNER